MATARSSVVHARHHLVTAAPRRRATRLIAAVAAAGSVGTALALATPGWSAAAPSPSPTIRSVEARIAAINTQAEKITEAYDAARGRLADFKGKVRAARATLAKDQKVLDGMQGRIQAIATAAYESGGLSDATTLLQTGNPASVANRTSQLAVVAQTRRAELAQALAADRAVRADRASYTAQLAAERATVASIATKRHQIQALLAKEQRTLDSLKAAQRRRLAEQRARERAQALAARRAYHPAPAATQHASYSGPATGSAATAVKFAYAQLGKPYVYGGAGPNSYDCSGLTMASWAAAGVSLPHNAAAQQASIPAVSLSALQPGDLVFFGSPAYHVAIYIGGGRIIQAPHTGAYVEITPLSYMTPSGAGRP